MPESLQIAQSETPLYLLSNMANRHGLVAGATGTGKTVTLQVMAESFSRIGVPVFAADIKGDLSRNQPARYRQSQDRRARERDEADGFFVWWLPGHLLGCLWRAGPSDSRHGF